MTHKIMLYAAMLCFAGCSPKPILYQNEHYRQVGAEAAKADIKACMDLAEEAGASPNKGKAVDTATNTVVGGAVGSAAGAVGGAVFGNAGTGAMVGAASGASAGFLRGLFTSSAPSGTYTHYVDRCLRERGYEPTGWE